MNIGLPYISAVPQHSLTMRDGFTGQRVSGHVRIQNNDRLPGLLGEFKHGKDAAKGQPVIDTDAAGPESSSHCTCPLNQYETPAGICVKVITNENVALWSSFFANPHFSHRILCLHRLLDIA